MSASHDSMSATPVRHQFIIWSKADLLSIASHDDVIK